MRTLRQGFQFFAPLLMVFGLLGLSLLGSARAEAFQSSSQSGYLPAVYHSIPPTPTVTPVPTKPPPGGTYFSGHTFSFYVTFINTSWLYNMGCFLGTSDLNTPGPQDSLVLLDFGYPTYINGKYGANLLGYGAVTTDQITSAALQFAWGYYVCTGSDYDLHLRVGIGTNNYPGDDHSSVTFEHGAAWAKMINQMNDWLVAQNVSGQVDFAGANDIELSWNKPASSIQWLDGYNSVNQYDLINFGALPGCPYLASPGAQCGSYPNVWDKEEVWKVIYGSAPVYPLPEIYLINGVNAQQWYLMSQYSYEKHGYPVNFMGSLTTYSACKQKGGCSGVGWGIDNKPDAGWNQLYQLLNSNPNTKQALHFASDMCWTSPSDWEKLREIRFSPCEAFRTTPVAQPTMSGSLTDSLSLNLQGEQLSAADRAALEEKLAIANRLDSNRATGADHRAVKEQSLHAVPEEPVPAFAFANGEQIIAGSEGLVRPSEASIQNLWRGVVDGNAYQVLAGALPDDEERGLLILFESGAGDEDASPHAFLAPDGTGSLRVEAREGSRLKLISAQGGEIFFDLLEKNFQ